GVSEDALLGEDREVEGELALDGGIALALREFEPLDRDSFGRVAERTVVNLAFDTLIGDVRDVPGHGEDGGVGRAGDPRVQRRRSVERAERRVRGGEDAQIERVDVAGQGQGHAGRPGPVLLREAPEALLQGEGRANRASEVDVARARFPAYAAHREHSGRVLELERQGVAPDAAECRLEDIQPYGDVGIGEGARGEEL